MADSEFYHPIRRAVDAELEHVVAVSEDGKLSWGEALRIVDEAIVQAVEIAGTIAQLPGPEKKKAVIQAVINLIVEELLPRLQSPQWLIDWLTILIGNRVEAVLKTPQAKVKP